MDLSEVRVVLTPEDLERVGRFRYSIYVEEQGKTARYADHARKTLIEPEDRSPKSMVLLIEREGEVTGSVRADIGPFDAEIAAQLQLHRLQFLRQEQMLLFSRMMIALDERHRDATPKLFFAALGLALSKGLRIGLLTCQPKLRPMFEAYGALQYGVEFQHDDAGTQIPMASLGEPAYFASRQSPATEWVRMHRPESPHTNAFLRIAEEVSVPSAIRKATRLVAELD